MILQPFTGTVKAIQYKKIEPSQYDEAPKYYNRLEVEVFEDEFGESLGATGYYAKLDIQENRRGRKAKKHLLNVTIYLTEEEYKNKVVDMGDIITFNKATLFSKTFPIHITDKELIKDNPVAKIRTNPITKETYAEQKISAIKISCKQGNWKLKLKHDKLHFWNINRCHFNFDTKVELLNQDSFDYFLEKEEYEKLLPLNEQTTEAHAYSMGQAAGTMMVKVMVGHKEDIDKYFCHITKVEEQIQ